MSDLAERLAAEEAKRRTRTERELEALGEGSSTPTTPPPKREAPPPKPEEKVGVGRDLVDETTRVILKGLDERIAALASAGTNPQMLAELRARRKLILEEAARAKK